MVSVIVYLTQSGSLENQENDQKWIRVTKDMPYANNDIKRKELYKIVTSLLIRTNDTRFNLGNHNILLETNYDLWFE